MKLFSKKDIVFVAVLLFVAVIIALVLNNNKVGNTYKITVNSKVVCHESIHKKKTTYLKNGVVIICNGESVYFDNSDCPDLLCVGMGKLSHNGDWAACLPNETYLEVME